MKFLNYNLYQWLGVSGFVVSGGFWYKMQDGYAIPYFILGCLAFWFGEYFLFTKKHD